MTQGLVPPHSIEAEQALIGAIFLDNDLLKPCLKIVPDHKMFYREAHQIIWWAFRNVVGNIDWLTVGNWLESKHALKKVGGMQALEAITEATPIGVGGTQYAHLVRKKWVARKNIEIAQDLANRAYDADVEPLEELAHSLNTLKELYRNVKTTPDTNVAQSALDWYDSLTDPNSMDNLICGHPVVDGEAMGFNLGGMSQLMGPSGGGKTYLLHQLMVRMHEYYGIKCGMLQGEMRGDRLLVRQSAGKLGMRAALNIRYAKIANQEPSQVDLNRFRMGRDKVEGLGKVMYPSPRPKDLKLQTVVDTIQELADDGCVFIGVDYIQAIRSRFSGVEGLKEVTQTLKDLAISNNVHICAVSQIVATSARDKDKSAWDLTKWDSSGGSYIINDFDLIASVLRPAYLKNDQGKAVRDIGYGSDKITAMKILKARFGEDDSVAFWKNVSGETGPEIEVPDDSVIEMLKIALRMPTETDDTPHGTF